MDDLVPPNIEALVPYEPGKPVEELERELGISGAIKLASNENAFGASPRALEAAHAALAQTHRYPDGGAYRLRLTLAEHTGLPMDQIVVGNGSSELIDLAVRVFCAPGRDEVLTHRYAFVSYRLVTQAHGVAFREVPLRADLSLDVDVLLAAVGERTKLVFLPNPNNPTGRHVPRADLERLIAGLPRRVVLVVDEAYHEYAAALPDYALAEPYRRQHPLLLSLRTFSKIYGLAGLRVGYGLADARVVGYLNRVRPAFNVGAAAQEAARAALADTAHLERSLRGNADGRAQLQAGLGRLGLHTTPSATNFVLVDVGRDAAPVYDSLLRRGVIVRPLRPQGLPRHLRISVGTRDENERALAALAAVLAP
jgi:histidinol-phosphate aminotransferase